MGRQQKYATLTNIYLLWWRFFSLFSRKMYFNLQNFITVSSNVTNATLRASWLCILRSKTHEIIGNVGLRFCKLAFLWINNQIIYKSSKIQFWNNKNWKKYWHWKRFINLKRKKKKNAKIFKMLTLKTLIFALRLECDRYV